MTDLQTIRKYNFTDGTTIILKIDRENNKVSFVEQNDTFNGLYQDKQWLFADRGLQYMIGWLNILNCMKYAIEDAKKDLEAYEQEKSEQLIDMFVALNQKGTTHD